MNDRLASASWEDQSEAARKYPADCGAAPAQQIITVRATPLWLNRVRFHQPLDRGVPMLANRVVVLLMAAVGMLPAADPLLFIAPVAQSSLATYDASTLTLVNGFLAGGNAKAVTLASDGTSAYVGATAEGVVWQIDLATGKRLKTFPTGRNPIALGMSPDGTKLYALTSATESYLFSFDTGTGSQIGKVPVGYNSTSLAVSPDGKKIYVANLFKIIDFNAPTLVAVGTVPVEATTMVFGPSSRVLYASTLQSAQPVVVISTASDSVTATVSTGSASVYGLTVSTDGNSLYSASSQGLLRIATSTNQIVEVFDKNQSFFGVALSPDGSTAFCIGTPNVSIDLATAGTQPLPSNGYASAAVYSATGNHIYILIDQTFDIDYARESTNQVSGVVTGVPGNYLLAASANGNKVGAIYSAAGKFSLIDAASHLVEKTYSFVPSFGLAGLALNTVGTMAFFPVDNPTELKILNLENGTAKKLPIPNSGPNLYIVVSPDDTSAYVSGPQLCAIDVATATVTKCGPTLTLAYTGLLRTLVLDSTGSRIFAIGASSVGEYDASSLKLLKTVSLPSGQNANGIAYSAATNSIYVIGTDTTTASGVVLRVDVASFTAVASASITSLLADITVSPDGRQVYLAAYSQQIPILDGTTLATVGAIGKIQASSLATTAR